MEREPPPLAGLVLFLPWVTVPQPVVVGGFRFAPIDANDPAPVIGDDIAETVRQVLKIYVDRSGNPIQSCTIVLQPQHRQAWNIPEDMWWRARRAAEVLALACLAEQRFLEGPFSPHLNATMFRMMGQGIVAGSDEIALFYRRRGGGLSDGGIHFKDVRFQRPEQVEGTECKVIGTRLAKALDEARCKKVSVWEPTASSLELFLLAHAETPALDWDTCVILSAMAFERLLEPNPTTAQGIAVAFAELWKPYTTRTIDQAKRVKPDPQWVQVQQPWPLHRKWMKELYEARSSQTHRGPRPEFSRNWAEEQHIVIAAFAYPLAVKLMLAAAGLYELSDEEMGACDALDKLLDSDWGRGWRKPPEWSKLLSLSEQSRRLKRSMEEAWEKATGRPLDEAP